MKKSAFTFRELLSRTSALSRVQAGRAIFAVAVMSGLAIAFELNGSQLGLFSIFISIYFQHELTKHSLDGLGLLPGGFRTRRLGALLGLVLLTQLAIFLGFILLVIPGTILLVRWFISVPVLITEEAGVFESLQISWEETAGRFWPLLAMLLVIYLPAILLNFGAELIGRGGANDTVAIVLTNVATYGSFVIGWCAAVAAYSIRRGGSAGLADVFA